MKTILSIPAGTAARLTLICSSSPSPSPVRLSPVCSIEHTGDNLTGEGEGDDEQIKVNLAAVPAGMDKIVFIVSIYDADNRRQSFGQVRNAFIRVVNQTGGTEIARYD